MDNLDQLCSYLKQYSLISKLETSRKVCHSLPQHFPNIAQLSVFNCEQDQQLLLTNIGTIYNFEMEYFALASTVCSENCRNGILQNYNQFSELMNILKQTSVAPKNKPIDNIEWTLTFLRMGIQQHSNPEVPYANTLRFSYFFNYSDDKIDVKSIFSELFKLSFQDYMLLVFALFALSSHHQTPMTKNNVIRSIKQIPYFNNTDIEEMIKLLCVNRDNFIKIYDEFKITDRKLRLYDYNPYLKYPFLEYKELLLLPITHFLFRSICEGFFHRICDERGNSFRQLFGKHVFEKWVGEVLSWDTDSFKVIPEFDYGKKNGDKSPDYILLKNNKMIFIEAKSTTPSLRIRENDLNIFEDQLMKCFGNATMQCIKKEIAYLNGKFVNANIPEGITDIYYIIVVLEDFHIPPDDNLKNYVKKNCKNTQQKAILDKRKPLLISISILESIIEEYDGDIFEYMHAWDSDLETKFPNCYIDYSQVKIDNLRAYKYFTDSYKLFKNKNQNITQSP